MNFKKSHKLFDLFDKKGWLNKPEVEAPEMDAPAAIDPKKGNGKPAELSNAAKKKIKAREKAEAKAAAENNSDEGTDEGTEGEEGKEEKIVG
jgi:hypothetical protein